MRFSLEHVALIESIATPQQWQLHPPPPPPRDRSA
jgi:hypothetical protein